MKRKILLITIIITSLLTIGCSKKIVENEDKVVDSIILDDNTKKTTNTKAEIKTKIIAKTENMGLEFSGKPTKDSKNWGTATTINNKIAYYSHSDIKEGDIIPQFPKLSLDGLKIGTITEDKDENGLNKIEWENKNITGRLLIPYMGEPFVRILSNNKVYKIDKDGELQEIKAYEKLIKDKDGDLNRFGADGGGKLDTYYLDSEPGKIGEKVFIDTENDKYFEISADALASTTEKQMIPLAIEDDRLYMRFSNTSGDMSTTVGYFENNKYTEILSPKDGVNIEVKGEMIYSNGRILFSGFAENKNGIWNYDIKNKKLTNVIEVESQTFYLFNLNKEKNKVIISGSDYSKGSNIYSLNIAEIDENLVLYNLTNIISTEIKDGWKNFGGWSENGDEFYLYSWERKDGYSELNAYYEVYKVED